MKKTIMAVILCAATWCMHAQEKEALINQFKSSPEFERVLKDFGTLGEADFSNAAVNYIEANGKYPYGTLKFQTEGKTIAVLEFVPVPEKLDRVLPNNDRYAMQLIDFRKFDANAGNGMIESYDLNYDNGRIAEIAVENRKLARFEVFEITEEIMQKYKGLIPLAGATEEERKAHLCDYNGNGNLSFAECYKCTKTICHGDPECDFLCTLLNYAGSYVGAPKACHLSFAASCIVIAMLM